MEKITEKKWSDWGLSFWIREAIAAIATCSASKLHIPEDNSYLKNNYDSEIKGADRFHERHAHQKTEIAICNGGEALMELKDGVLHLPYPSAIVFRPHIVHCHAGRPDWDMHSTLWLIFSGDKLLINNLVYHPDGRWNSAGSFYRKGDSIEKFKEKLCSGQFCKHSEGKELFRAELLDLLNSSYQHLARTEIAEGKAENAASHAHLIRYVADYLEDNYSQYITLKFLGQIARLSPNHLNFLFKKQYGMTIYAYLIKCRMEAAMEYLQTGNLKVKHVALDVGYDDPLYFSRAFKKYFGFWPTEVSEA